MSFMSAFFGLIAALLLAGEFPAGALFFALVAINRALHSAAYCYTTGKPKRSEVKFTLGPTPEPKPKAPNPPPHGRN